MIHTQTDRHTDAGNDITRRPKLASGNKNETNITVLFTSSFLHSGRRPTGAKRPSAGCPECICNRPRPWRRPCVSDWGCGAVILLSRGEFGREKNKICYQRGCVWTFYYMPNLWYNIVILQHIFILRNNRCERSYFVFNLGSFARNRECETQVCVFGVFFFKYLLKNKISIHANHVCSTFTEKILQ